MSSNIVNDTVESANLYKIHSSYTKSIEGHYNYGTAYYGEIGEYEIITEKDKRKYFKGLLTSNRDNLKVKIVFEVEIKDVYSNYPCVCIDPYLELGYVDPNIRVGTQKDKSGIYTEELILNSGHTVDIYVGCGDSPMTSEPIVKNVKVYIGEPVESLPISAGIKDIMDKVGQVVEVVESHRSDLKDALINKGVDVVEGEKM